MYSIFWESNPIGTAEVFEEGLYYRFSCKCFRELNGINRIIVINGKKKIDLGICVPEKNKFILSRRIPRKCFEDKFFSFELIPDGYFAENVYTGMRFENLDKIKATRFINKNGQPQIIIDESRAQQGNDQNPIYQSKSGRQ